MYTWWVYPEAGTDNGSQYLPSMAQISPLMSTRLLDMNADGNLDIMGAGNFFGSETETIRYDAGSGICLIGDGKGNFSSLSVRESGFYANGDVKDMEVIQLADGTTGILVSGNNGLLRLFSTTENVPGEPAISMRGSW